MGNKKLDIMCKLATMQMKYITIMANEDSTKLERKLANEHIRAIQERIGNVYFGKRNKITRSRQQRITNKITKWMKIICTKDTDGANKIVHCSDEYNIDIKVIADEVSRISNQKHKMDIELDDHVMHNMDGEIRVIIGNITITIDYENYGAKYNLVLHGFEM